MRAAAAVLLACAAAAAAADAPFWMRRHEARRYAAHHSLALTVKNTAKGRAAVEKALADSGGVSLVAPENRVGSDKVGYAQWSYALTLAQAEKALKRLRKLGAVTRDERRAEPAPADLEEARLKRERLAAERETAKPYLDRFPSTAAAAQEALDHLTRVVAEDDAAADRLLLNVSLEGPPASGSR